MNTEHFNPEDFNEIAKQALSYFRLTYDQWNKIYYSGPGPGKILEQINHIFSFDPCPGSKRIKFDHTELQQFLEKDIWPVPKDPTVLEEQNRLLKFKIVVACLFEMYIRWSRSDKNDSNPDVRRHFEGMLRPQRTSQEPVNLSERADIKLFREVFFNKEKFKRLPPYEALKIAKNKFLNSKKTQPDFKKFEISALKFLNEIESKRFDTSIFKSGIERLLIVARASIISGKTNPDTGPFENEWEVFENKIVPKGITFVKLSLNSKYKIIGINVSYFVLLCLLSPFKDLERCYLTCPSDRNAFLTEGLFFYPNSDPGGDEFRSLHFFDCLQKENPGVSVDRCTTFTQTIVDILNRPEVWDPEMDFRDLGCYGIFFGIGMVIPYGVKTLLVANRLRPTLFIRGSISAAPGSKYFEITLEETAWNVNWITTSSDMIRFGSQVSDLQNGDSGEIPYIQPLYNDSIGPRSVENNKTEKSFSSHNIKGGEGSISKTQGIGSIVRGLRQVDYSTLEAEVQQAFQDCDVLITLNHTPPRSDTMLLISFKDSTQNILLSCT